MAEPVSSGNAPHPSAAKHPQTLETGVPLSQSIIWRLQRAFYSQRGLKAWTEDMVPSYITNNPFIAEIYAEIVTAFLDDCMKEDRMSPGQSASRVSPENPLRILELGAGTGRFSFLFLSKLSVLLEARKLPPEIVRYSMSDCSDSLLQFWSANRYLAPFVASGVLDFQLHSQESQEPHGADGAVARPAGQASGPLVVIANYVFDSLPQDAFVIAEGQISEALITTASSTVDEGTAPPLLGNLQLSFKNVPLAGDRYADKQWNSILKHYVERLPAATLLFPSAALEILQQLCRTCDGRMLVLAADKGFTREDDLALLQGPPQLEFHAGNHCFSQAVNFDAIARYFYSLDGHALLPEKRISSLNICAFLAPRSGNDFVLIRAAYRGIQKAFGPDDLFALMSWLNAHLEEISVPQALALLRLTRWDPTALQRLFPVIAPQLRSVHAERADFRDTVLSTWANHYPITPEDNALAFNCGVILLELRFFAEAVLLFQASERQLGRTATTSYNLGLCALGLGRSDQALAFMVDACNLDPAFEPARRSRLTLEQKIAADAR
ncbi:MAG TPA: SAM-dependent methyltransferase [Candidatus Angelobacter sp.]|nr:SAM-dependent methyltransferase [Candidatus Angelobacter sp.]